MLKKENISTAASYVLSICKYIDQSHVPYKYQLYINVKYILRSYFVLNKFNHGNAIKGI